MGDKRAVKSMKWVCLPARFGIIGLLFLLECHSSRAQDFYQSSRARWLAIATANTPTLAERVVRPHRIGVLQQDSAAFQGWRIDSVLPVDSLYRNGFKAQTGVVLDFGEHYTGYVTFTLATMHRTPDAPFRLKFTFGEVPSELATPFDPYPGSLSRAWLQDEIVTVNEIPATITIPRRLAFRYAKVELLTPSIAYDFKLTDILVKAVTSASTQVADLPSDTEPLIKQIDRVGLRTLRECMQTVYEDGPKRDRRLWIGDLYLEALANSFSYRNHQLTKRCLYLLAALSNQAGYLHGTVFERPQPHPQEGQRLFDYSLLYNVALKDYYQYTQDKKTAADLWPVAKKQLDIVKQYVLPNGLIDYERAAKEIWIFIDWKDGLHKQAAIQGLAIYAIKETQVLAKALGKAHEVAEWSAVVEHMSQAAKKYLYDRDKQLFISGGDKQVSYASQIWMVLGGVATMKENQKVMSGLQNYADALKPGGPYLYHYYVQALIQCGMATEAKNTLLNYWGGMIKKGADTFWEVYDPEDDFRSPYHFFPMNSYCHAWSCTPVYFIRKYPAIFCGN